MMTAKTAMAETAMGTATAMAMMPPLPLMATMLMTMTVLSAAATSPSTRVLGLVAAALTTKVKNEGSSPGVVSSIHAHSLP
jgi:hypothetical protein